MNSIPDRRVAAIRADIHRWGLLLTDPEKPPHILVIAGKSIAELQLELQEQAAQHHPRRHRVDRHRQ